MKQTYAVEVVGKTNGLQNYTARSDTTVGQMRQELGLEAQLVLDGAAEQKPLDDAMQIGNLGVEGRIRVIEAVGVVGGYNKKA
ncbi:MAG TPA: hypothetical protein VJB68_06150, partial [Methylophilaceae bacterium]|nr:hypothetical protein [Methylophilaceae bacterium]